MIIRNIEIEKMRGYLLIYHERSCESFKCKIIELKLYIKGEKFNPNDPNQLYRAKLIFIENYKALLNKKLISILNTFRFFMSELVQITPSNMFNNKILLANLVDFLYSFSLIQSNAFKEMAEKFWSFFHPKIKEKLQESQASHEIIVIVNVVKFNLMQEHQVIKLIKELLSQPDSEIHRMDSQSFDDSPSQFLKEIKQIKEF